MSSVGTMSLDCLVWHNVLCGTVSSVGTISCLWIVLCGTLSRLGTVLLLVQCWSVLTQCLVLAPRLVLTQCLVLAPRLVLTQCLVLAV